MTEEFILSYAKDRVGQLGYEKFYLRYRDFMILPNSSLSVEGDLWFVVDDPAGVLIESDYGFYDTTGVYINENSHEHKGEIVITNPDSESKKLKLIQVIIVS